MIARGKEGGGGGQRRTENEGSRKKDDGSAFSSQVHWGTGLVNPFYPQIFE